MKIFRDSRMRVLDEDLVEKIHRRSLDILSEIGVKVKSDLAKNILTDHGCLLENGKILFPPALVDKTCKSCGQKISIYSRTGKVVNAENEDILIHNAGTTRTIFDSVTQKKREATLSDAKKLAKILDSLDNIDALSPIVYPQDVPQEVSMLYALKEFIVNSEKPVFAPGADSLLKMKYIHKLYTTAAGGEANLRNRPMYTVGYSPKSPLTLIEKDTEAIIWAAKREIPIKILPSPIAGLTAPLPLMGVLTQQNAEILATIVLLKLVNEKVKVVYGARSSCANLYQASLAGGPERGVLGACAVQIANYYGMTSDVYGAGTSSFISDIQAGTEKTMNILLPALMGADWISGPGILGHGDTISYEQLLIDDEIFDFLLYTFKRMKRDKEELWYDAIADVMEGKDEFISHENTVKNLRSEEMWERKDRLFNMNDYNSWEKMSEKDIIVKAQKKADEIIKNHELTNPLPEKVVGDMEKIIKKAKKDLTGD